MRKTIIFKVVMIMACLMAWLDVAAQLVDRATFEQHLAKAHSLAPQRKAAASPITLTQNPFEIEEFTMNIGSSTKQVNMYFNTAVMAAYRTECCPRVTQFDIELPAGFNISALGSALQSSGISVVGNIEGNTMHFLGYGTLTADQLDDLPTGRIHYATLTLQASNATVGNYTMTMSNACFAMADEPKNFIVDGSYPFMFNVSRLVTSISLSKSSATIAVGGTLQLTYSVTPSNATNKAVTWTSSNPAVATVSTGGLVTAKSIGSATITATTIDGSNLSASCAVTVTPQLATGVTLSQTTASIIVDNTLQLTATVSPEDTADKSVTWSSSNTSVATVSSTGLVTAKMVGTATITVTTADGSNKSATCQVTVTPRFATGITLSQTTASIVIDKTLQLNATVSPSNTTNQSVSWTSSNTSVARVNSNGLVTAKAVGTATITATTQDGTNLSASCQVTVTPQLATGISLNKTSATIYDGTTLQLAATISPSNTTNKTIAWSSSNTAVATVSSNGLVTAMKPGTASITVTTQDGSNLSATCAVTVIPQLATGITLNQSTAEVAVGSTTTLTATITPANTTNNNVTWTSSNTVVATVSSSGMVTAKARGTATITATTADGSNLSASCAVTVIQLATGISLNQTTATLNNGETVRLTATVTPSNANNPAVTWTSSNTSVATVNSNGLVTAKGRGTATITATTADGTNLSTTCAVTVNQLATGISLSQTAASIVVDKTLQLTATVTPSNTTNKTVTWASSNTSVATVSSSGKVTAKAPGTATITATTADGSNLSASCAVTVIQLATGISLNQTTATLNNGETVRLTATVTPSNANNPAVTWTSSNTSVATVNSNGLVTAKGRGTATITATTADGSNLSATCAVTVNQLATGISLSQTAASIVVDKTLQLTATVLPSNANNNAVSWTSSNTSVATVSSSGLVTAKAVGSATITATTTDGTNLSASCAVTVNPQLATGISLNQTSADINMGQSITLVATVVPSNTTNPNVKWTTENAAIATVVRGVVRGVGEGECYITATTQDGTNLSAQCLVAVTGGGTNIQVTNVMLSETNVTLTEGSSTVITANVLPENATNKTLVWTSSNTAVATINANGVLQAIAAGTATINATTTDGSNISATCNVTVNSSTVNVPNYLSANDLPEMVAGQQFVIPITLTNADPITAIQADLYLPSGIEPNYNDNDQFVWLDEDRKGRNHVVSATVSAVATRIMVSSSRNAAFNGNEGTVMYIGLRVNPDQVTGTYGIDLKNIILSSTSGEMFEAPNVKINLGVAAYHSGDANGDGYIDDTDYVITANYILAQNPNNFVFSAADMSGDGRVYVNDLPLIINAAMAFDFEVYNAPRRAPAQAAANNALYVNDFDMAGNQTKTLSIMLDNATAFSAVQCDINLPAGVSIVEQTDEWGDPAYALLSSARSNDHDAWSDITGSGDVRLIITNSISRPLKGSSGAIATFKVRSAAGFSGEHELTLRNIVCADADATRYALPDAVCLINHAAGVTGDVDGNGSVDGNDLNMLINILLGKLSVNDASVKGEPNVDGNGGIDGSDLNALINIILGK